MVPVVAMAFGESLARERWFLLGYMLFLGLFVGVSDMLGGYDRYIYGEIFDAIAAGVERDRSVEQIPAMLFFEVGYSWINWAIAHFTVNRYVFIFTFTMLIYLNFYIAFRRHITNYPFAFVVFMGMMFFFSFTYLRQVYGVSLALLSIKPLIERKWWLFAVIMVCVALVHKSGAVFALMFFVPRRRLPIPQVMAVLGVCLVVGLSGATSALYDAYIEVADLDLEVTGDYSSDDGARYAYLVEVLVFAGVILNNYDTINDTRESNLFLNMALMFCAVLLLFIRSENGGRMAWYFIFGIIITLTNIVENCKYGISVVVKPMLVTLFFGLFMRIVLGWGMLVWPYKSFFTNGHREGDFIYEQFEYDGRYDSDKFYK